MARNESPRKPESAPLLWPWLGPAFRVGPARARLEELIERDASQESWCFAGDGEHPPRPGQGGRTRRPR